MQEASTQDVEKGLLDVPCDRALDLVMRQTRVERRKIERRESW